MPIFSYHGIDADYREMAEGEEILYKDLPIDQQRFTLTEIPFTEEELVQISKRSYTYTELQKNWVDRENKRMNEGVYAMIRGVLTFIPGSHYGYCNYWTLEDGMKPKYRNITRKFFLVKEFLCFRTKLKGVVRGKHRRKGATSEGTFWEWWICGRGREKIGGMISYNDESVQKIFDMMFGRGIRELLPCFLEDISAHTATYIHFQEKPSSTKKGFIEKPKGLNSFIDCQPTTINSYDSGRLTYILIDESGKWPKVDINTYWSKVQPTLGKGTKKVGFAYFPSTVNPLNEGGENFEIFWGLANQNAINPITGLPYGLNTPSSVVRIFEPATEGYEGCVDWWGESIIEDPAEPVLNDDGEWVTVGARSIIEKERSLKTGEQLMEHRRDFPLNEYDMFAFLTGECQFNEDNIKHQLKKLEDDPPYIRQLKLTIKTKMVKSIVAGKPDKEESKIEWVGDKSSGWYVYEVPTKQNAFENRGGTFSPTNAIAYSIGVDTTQDRIAIDGSNPCILVFKKSCIVDGEETGNYPVAMWISQTRLDIHFDEEVLKACMWYGCKATYELDRRTDFYRFFMERGAGEFLQWTPKNARNPLKPNKQPEYGIRSGDPFQLAQQLQVAKMYIDGTRSDEYNGHVHRVRFASLLKECLRYNHLDREKSDQVIALMMALLPVFGETSQPIINREVRSLLPTYKIKIPA